MPELSKNYQELKELLDTFGQTRFLEMYGTMDDIYQIQLRFIYATCKYYDTNFIIRDKNVKLKKE